MLLLSCVVLLAPLSANELLVRNSVNKNVRSLFLASDFAKLEDLAALYRDEQARTSSGLWMSTLFYASIENLVSYQQASPETWQYLYKISDAWIAKYPDSPTPYLAKSLITRQQAWSIRGTGYANTVKAESWQPFNEKIQAAKDILLESKSISSQEPHWYVVMVDIATEQSWQDAAFEELVDEGLARYPYYYQLYFDIMNYYTPKWHGDPVKIEAFASRAAELTKKKEGAGLYSRIYWAASQSQFKGRLFQNSHVRWPLMSQGIDDVLREYPDQWNINSFALFACLAEDQKKTRNLIAMIKGEPMKSAWLGNLKYYQYCETWSDSKI